MASSQPTPWKDGYYKSSTRSTSLFKVTGESVEMETLQGKMDEQLSKGNWKFGEFGGAHPDLIKHTGKSSYNVELNMMNGLWIRKGIISDDGLKIYLWAKNLELFEWITEEEYISLKNSGGREIQGGRLSNEEEGRSKGPSSIFDTHFIPS